ncbi:prepilin peptidase [Ornithinimicrobium panacihumi]|uniref:prepilin peptidase n=1 Tax=Ornithinimicrobium panacihumi TaxID=2008449 RepID=UPI003F8CC38C
MIAALLAIAGAVVGYLLRVALLSHGYRREDEQHLPRRGRRWLPVALALTWGLAGFAWWPEEPLYLVLVLVLSVPLVVLAAIDLDVQRLPDRWTLPTLAATTAAVVPVGLWSDRFAPLTEILACGMGALLVYTLMVFVPGSGMGGGDVKLAPTLGLLTGTLTWPLALLAGLITFGVAGVVGLGLMVAGRPRGTLMAFGPYMIIGALATVVLVPALAKL